MRCPFRVKALDFPDTCDTECAWLVDLTASDSYRPDEKPIRVCAVTAMAMGIHYYDVRPVNAIREES